MSVGRHLDWDGCWNARDLGGIRTADSREITRNAVVRSDHLHLLTPAGWSAVELHGIRTVVDLRSSWEAHAPLARRLGRKDDTNAIREVLQRNGCPSLRAAFLDTLTKVDVVARLRDGGLTDADVVAVRRRMFT